MRRKYRRGRRRGRAGRASRMLLWAIPVLAAAGIGFSGYAGVRWYKAYTAEREAGRPMTPEEELLSYMGCIESGEYERMYGMLSGESRQSVSLEAFTERNKKIYEGIGALDIRVQVTQVRENDGNGVTVYYNTDMDTLAGHVKFLNQADFLGIREEEKGPVSYRLIWNDSLIFPELTAYDKVRVVRESAARGEILDRNGVLLAGKGVASSVGLVPGKMERAPGEAASGGASDPAAPSAAPGGAAPDSALPGAASPDSVSSSPSIAQLAAILGVSPESIEKKLSAGWVKEDSFVPIKTIEKLTDLEQMADPVTEETQRKIAQRDALLAIPGVMISDTEVRDYPLGRAAAHLVGYIQQVTAEDLEKHPGEGYRSGSVIGRSGMELLYEKELKGQDGCRILIADEDGREKYTLAQIPKKDGQTIRLTIDAALQRPIYASYAEDKSCSVAMNPYTGEVLALVSTPSFDSRDFIYGMSQELWDSLNQDERMPLYNRFRQKLCPGSSFKPVTAAIGLKTGAIDPDMDYGNEGLSWQKDAGWGNYYVTTLHETAPANLKNALVLSDNIYFAKAALRIGADSMAHELDLLGFNRQLPFEIAVAESQYTNGEQIGSEIQLADSGYGQGQVLVNPVHLAALYTGFLNGGDVIKPYLLYREEAGPEVWLDGAYTPEAARLVEEGMEEVIRSPHGTGRRANREDVVLAGKTGTAEIKQTKDDTKGTELGWFCVATAQKETAFPILLVTMVEDVKGRGGSGYVVDHAAALLNEYFSRN